MRICKRCNKDLPDLSFITSTRGASSFCKQCIEDTFIYSDSSTYMNILKELDIPFIQEIWELSKESADKRGFDPHKTLYIYNAKMKLLAFKKFGYKDSEQFRRL